ncbi:unnamed protein product, partial [Ilex paraguariensis]
MDEVVSVSRSNPKKYSLHTTRSWEFVGLEEDTQNNLKKDDLLLKAKYGKDVVIGILDSGVWPESKSFSDEGMEPIPESWKGICQTGQAFTLSNCNKLIGDIQNLLIDDPPEFWKLVLVLGKILVSFQ